MKYADFGTVSHATMRTEDLLSAFADELDHQLSRQSRRFPRKEHRALIRDTRKATRELDNWKRDYEPEEIMEELFDALNTFAPPYAYFGAHPGDGSDYGFWLTEDLDCFDGLKVNDTAEVPRDYRGEVMHVNDHGNVTLYVAHGRKDRAPKLREIWALV